MTREELEKRLTAYTETEKRYIQEGPDGAADTAPPGTGRTQRKGIFSAPERISVSSGRTGSVRWALTNTIISN